MVVGLADGLRARSIGDQGKWISVPDGMYDLTVQRYLPDLAI